MRMIYYLSLLLTDFFVEAEYIVVQLMRDCYNKIRSNKNRVIERLLDWAIIYDMILSLLLFHCLNIDVSINK